MAKGLLLWWSNMLWSMVIDYQSNSSCMHKWAFSNWQYWLTIFLQVTSFEVYFCILLLHIWTWYALAYDLCSIIADLVGGRCAMNIRQTNWCVCFTQTLFIFAAIFPIGELSLSNHDFVCKLRLYHSSAFIQPLEFAVIVSMTPLGKLLFIQLFRIYILKYVCITVYHIPFWFSHSSILSRNKR